MTKTRQRIDQGAPLRAFFVIVAFWVLGRVFWESYTPNQMEAQNLATDVRAGLSTEITQAVLNETVDDQSTILITQKRREQFVSLSGSNNINLLTGSTLEQSETQAVLRTIKSKLIPRQATPNLPFQRSKGIDQIEYDAASLSKTKEQARALVSNGPVSAAGDASDLPRKTNWSGYFWIFARQGSPGATSGSTIALPQSGGGQYGGSQAGAILTYRVSGSEKRGLSLFSRVSSPLAVRSEEELAIGSSVRPFKDLPIGVYAEQRFGRAGSLDRGTAIYIAGGTGPDKIAENISLETYGQAGYLQNKQNTYFFDGSASLQRQLFKQDKKRVTIGGAIWAGGQKNVSRLDIGPRVNIELPVGDFATRVSVDWRQRVAGNARPDSGLAISISTGF